MSTNNLTPHQALSAARIGNWSAKKLAAAMNPPISEISAQKLLNGSATIRNVATNGAFQVYVPGNTVG